MLWSPGVFMSEPSHVSSLSLCRVKVPVDFAAGTRSSEPSVCFPPNAVITRHNVLSNPYSEV